MTKNQGVALIVFVLVLIVVVGGGQMIQHLDHERLITAQGMPIEWEYLIVGFEDQEIQEEMDSLGELGWELAFARRAMTGGEYDRRGLYECIFKREVTPPGRD